MLCILKHMTVDTIHLERGNVLLNTAGIHDESIPNKTGVEISKVYSDSSFVFHGYFQDFQDSVFLQISRRERPKGYCTTPIRPGPSATLHPLRKTFGSISTPLTTHTVFFIRKENSPTELIPEIWGYNWAFSEVSSPFLSRPYQPQRSLLPSSKLSI